MSKEIKSFFGVKIVVYSPEQEKKIKRGWDITAIVALIVSIIFIIVFKAI